MKKLLAICLLVPTLVFAGRCGNHPDDSWGGPDKREHFAGGFIISTVVGTQTKSPWIGFAAGAGTGILYELLDTGVCSWKDAAATALGAGFGAAGSYVFIRIKPAEDFRNTGVYINATIQLK